jgi:glycerate kinase
MKVLIRLNPFKNALSVEAAGLVWRGGISVHDPNAQVEIIPIVDGGDGSLKSPIKYFGAELMS